MYGVLWHYDFSIVGGLGLAAFNYPVADVTRLKSEPGWRRFSSTGPPAALFGLRLLDISSCPPGAAPAHAEDFAHGSMISLLEFVRSKP